MSNYIFPDGRYGDAMQVVYDEIQRALGKHNPHGDKNFHSHHEGFAILHEEVDELWDDVKHDKKEEAIEEAIQVAAMAIRFIAELGTYPYNKSKTDRENFEKEINDLASKYGFTLDKTWNKILGESKPADFKH